MHEVLLTPLGMAQTSYLPRPHAQPGWSVDHFTGIRTLEPLADTGAMAPAGQLWSTIADLVAWGQFLAGARPDLLDPSTLHEMSSPSDRGLRARVCASRPMPGGLLVGHTGSMPGFMAALFVDPGSGIGAAVLTNATTGIDTHQLAIDLIDGDFIDDVPDPWRPDRDAAGGGRGCARAVVLGQQCHRGALAQPGPRPAAAGAFGNGGDRFELDGDGELVGVSGYHRGETLLLHRRDDGTVGHLECATWIYTRTPYDPEAPIPGGHPPR